MSDIEELQQAQIKSVRKQILKLLYISGISGANEKTLAIALESYGFAVTCTEIRRHLDYLEQRRVIEIVDRDKSVWAAKLTPTGIDIAENTVKFPDWLKP